MYFPFWKATEIPPELAAHVGGYGVIKESIMLERKGQKLLRKTCSNHHGSLRLLSVKLPEYTHSYILTTVQLKWKAEYQFPRWPGKEDHTSDTSDGTGIFKEKIKLDDESFAFLKWVQKTKSIKLLFPTFDKQIESAFIYESFNLEPVRLSKKVQKPYLGPEEMPSALQSRISSIMDEKLTSVTAPQYTGCWNLEHRGFHQELKSSLIVHSVGLRSVRKSFRLSEQWVTDAKLRDCDESNKRREEQLFDLEFNVLDFYKVRLPDRKATSTPMGQYNCILGDAWRIPRDQLRSLEWSPLRKLTRSISSRMKRWNEIECYSIRQPEWSLTFQKLLYNSVDFIDLTRKSLGTLIINIPQKKVISNFEGQVGYSDTEEFRLSAQISKPERISGNSTLNTSLVPEVSSFIDDDLKSLLSVKRRKLTGRKEKGYADDTEEPFNVSVLRALNERSNNKETRDQINNMKNHAKSPSQELNSNTTAFHIEALHSIDKSILINCDRINKNRRVIQSLYHKSGLKLIEQGHLKMCDFVLNPITCVVRLQLGKFFQVKENGALFYEDTLIGLLAEFKRIIILLEYDAIMENVDREVFWKIRHLISGPEFELYLTLNHHESVSRWICSLAQKYSDKYDDEAFEHLDIAEELLADLELNRFQIKVLLAAHRVSDLFLMVTDRDNEELENILTPAQTQRINELVHLQW